MEKESVKCSEIQQRKVRLCFYLLHTYLITPSLLVSSRYRRVASATGECFTSFSYVAT